MEDFDMQNWQHSDNMICNTKANLTFQHKKQNDLMFYKSIGTSLLSPMRDPTTEFNLLSGKDPRSCNLSKAFTSRGGNSLNCSDTPCKSIPQGYDCMKQQNIQEYLLMPCKQNTFRNHIVCDDTKCCSKRHQLFMNITKRK